MSDKTIFSEQETDRQINPNRDPLGCVWYSIMGLGGFAGTYWFLSHAFEDRQPLGDPALGGGLMFAGISVGLFLVAQNKGLVSGGRITRAVGGVLLLLSAGLFFCGCDLFDLRDVPTR